MSDDDIEDMEFDPSRMVAWAKKKGTDGDVKGKGKASGNKTVEGLAGSLPPEILIHVSVNLSSSPWLAGYLLYGLLIAPNSDLSPVVLQSGPAVRLTGLAELVSLRIPHTVV